MAMKKTRCLRLMSLVRYHITLKHANLYHMCKLYKKEGSLGSEPTTSPGFGMNLIHLDYHCRKACQL